MGSAHPLVQLHPNVGVPAAAVHRRRLLPAEIHHLDASSGIPVETRVSPQKNVGTRALALAQHTFPSVNTSELRVLHYSQEEEEDIKAAVKVFPGPIFSPDVRV